MTPLTDAQRAQAYAARDLRRAAKARPAMRYIWLVLLIQTIAGFVIAALIVWFIFWLP